MNAGFQPSTVALILKEHTLKIASENPSWKLKQTYTFMFFFQNRRGSTKTGPNFPPSRWVIWKPYSCHPKKSSHEFSHVFLVMLPKNPNSKRPKKIGDPKKETMVIQKPSIFRGFCFCCWFHGGKILVSLTQDMMSLQILELFDPKIYGSQAAKNPSPGIPYFFFPF